MMLLKENQIIDVPLNGGNNTRAGLTPVIGIDNGIGLDYYRKGESLLWLHGKEDDDENCTTYETQYGVGNKTELLEMESGLVGAYIISK
ncbi:unnamed protein product [Diamesa tonsa]